MAESKQHFMNRVYEATGVVFEDIPFGNPDCQLGGLIICRRGEWMVVSVGAPETDDMDWSEWMGNPEMWVKTNTRVEVIRAKR